MKDVNIMQYLIDNEFSFDESGLNWVHLKPNDESISFSNGPLEQNNPIEDHIAKFVFKHDEFEVVTDAFNNGKETRYKGCFMYDEFGRRTGISLNNSIFLFVMND
jgi:hypothetical protein